MMVLQRLRLGPLHGYALAQVIKTDSDDLLQIEEGSLYPALLRMLKAGWVEAEWGVSERNRKVRIYRITKSGKRQLATEVSAFKQMFEGIRKVMRLEES